MLLKAIGFFLLSSVKFAVATLPISLAFSFKEAWIISISGGIFGAFFFLYVWEYVIKLWNVFLVKKEDRVKVFRISKQRRKLVRMKNSYGFWGIIILTPLILSIPIGAFLLARYFKHKRFRFLYLSLSVVVWGSAFISFFELFW